MVDDNLEFCLGIAKKYDANLSDVIIKHGEISTHLLESFKDMPIDWYVMESNRRTKQYYKEQKTIYDGINN